jgi:hypothetical protein
MSADSVFFSGGGAERGASGAPLVGYGGVTGLVRESAGSGAYATPIRHVRSLFDQNHGAAWRWVLTNRPPPGRTGAIRMRRADNLTEAFNATILLANATNRVPLAPNRYTLVPVGRYRVEVAPLGSMRADISCDASEVDVAAFASQDLNLSCSVDPTGDWQLNDGRVLRIGEQSGTVFPVTVLNAGGEPIGTGTAQLRDDYHLSLDVNDEPYGVWAARLKLSSGMGRGRVSVVERGTEHDFFMARR